MKAKENRKSGEYLYKEIYDALRKDILSGKHRPGSMLPSANDLSTTYHVNRLTVRKAVSGLITEGLVYSRPGQGTYVAETPEDVLSRQSKIPDRFSKRAINVGIVSKMLVNDNISFYHSDMLAGIHKGLIENHANMTILAYHGNESDASLFAHVGRSQLDAAIYIGPFDVNGLRTMIEKGVPSVLIDFPIRKSGTDCILMDNVGGGQAAIDHLTSLGHRKIAIIVGSEDQPAASERLEGAMKAVREHGIPEDEIRIFHGNFKLRSGYDIVSEIIRSEDIPSAIFFMNDEMAYGGVQAFRELSKIRIPEDISIIGFDNNAYSLMASPHLTTISAPAMQMGRLAVQRLFAKLRNGGEYIQGTIQLDTCLTVRKSTGKPVKCQ